MVLLVSAESPLFRSRPGDKPYSRTWYGFAIALIAVHSMISFTSGRSYGLTIFGDTTQSVLIAFATTAMAVNVTRSESTRRTFWTLMCAGCALWLTAQLLWTVYEVVLRRDVPNPFVGDVVLFLHVIPFMAALALPPHIQKAHRDTALGVFDLVLLVLWWLYLYLLVVVPWQLVHPDVALYGYSFNVLTLFANLSFVVVVGLVALRAPSPWRRFCWHLFGAAGLYTAGSQFANAAIDRGRYYTGSIYDLPLVTSVVWLIYAATSARSLEPEVAPPKLTLSRVLLWPGRLAVSAVLSVPFVASVVLIYGPTAGPVFHFRLCLTLASFFVLCAIVFYKQHLLNRELITLIAEANNSLSNVLRLQGQLVQAEKLAALGQLVAGAAHEINNPLTAIIGYCDHAESELLALLRLDHDCYSLQRYRTMLATACNPER